MKLRELSREDCETIRQWRNQWLVSLRTPYMLTKEMQEDFYDKIICNRDSRHRYWAVYIDDPILAIGGITNIQWENSVGEISLIVDPQHLGREIGTKSVELILDQAFNYMNLKTIYGECYMCNPAVDFWKKIVDKYKGFQTGMPSRKFWNGDYWGSYYFSIDRDIWRRENEKETN